MNKQGETALHYAAKNNQFECVKALVRGGCDWKVANPDGYVKGTAADCAPHTARPAHSRSNSYTVQLHLFTSVIPPVHSHSLLDYIRHGAPDRLPTHDPH